MEMTTCLFEVNVGLSARKPLSGEVTLGFRALFSNALMSSFQMSIVSINDRKEKYFQKLGISKCTLTFFSLLQQILRK